MQGIALYVGINPIQLILVNGNSYFGNGIGTKNQIAFVSEKG